MAEEQKVGGECRPGDQRVRWRPEKERLHDYARLHEYPRRPPLPLLVRGNPESYLALPEVLRERWELRVAELLDAYELTEAEDIPVTVSGSPEQIGLTDEWDHQGIHFRVNFPVRVEAAIEGDDVYFFVPEAVA